MTNCSKNGFRQMAPPQQSDSQFRSSRPAPDRTALGQAALSCSTLDQAISGRSALGQAAPSRTALDQAVSGRSALGQAAPGRAALNQTVSDLAALGRTAPDQSAPDPDEMKFFIYLLELYAAERGTTADKVLKDWDRLCITDIIFDRCACYRGESLENAFTDIDSLRHGIVQ